MAQHDDVELEVTLVRKGRNEPDIRITDTSGTLDADTQLMVAWRWLDDYYGTWLGRQIENGFHGLPTVRSVLVDAGWTPPSSPDREVKDDWERIGPQQQIWIRVSKPLDKNMAYAPPAVNIMIEGQLSPESRDQITRALADGSVNFFERPNYLG